MIGALALTYEPAVTITPYMYIPMDNVKAHSLLFSLLSLTLSLGSNVANAVILILQVRKLRFRGSNLARYCVEPILACFLGIRPPGAPASGLQL